MGKKWLYWTNALLLGCFSALSIAIIGVAWIRPSEISMPQISERKTALPKGAFVLSKEAYQAIASSTLSLKFTSPIMQLPDLKPHLTYYGINGRPDATIDRTVLHFALANQKSFASIVPGERLYVLYDKSQTPGKYIFSPQNSETALWMEVLQEKNEAIVKVSMKNEQGDIIREPSPHAEFTLAEKEMARSTGNWDIGKWRVDGSLLARQRARWYGPDLFLENHGGDDFTIAMGKQRLDFGEEDETYSCFASEGDNLVWDGSRWEEVSTEEDTRGKPLLHVKKLDERLMHLEVWDPEGKSKVVLNLVKLTEPWAPQNIIKDFKFIGARTRTQCAFEIGQERMILKPHDWLLLTDAGWKKMTTSEEIDDYVARKLTGALFIFDGLIKKDDKQVLVGTIYNNARTEAHTIELAVQQNNTVVLPVVPYENTEGKKGERQASVTLPSINLPRTKG